MPAPEEPRKQIALTSLSTLLDSAKDFWWTDDDLAIILAASVGQPVPLNRLYRSWVFTGYLASLSTRCLFPENPGLQLIE